MGFFLFIFYFASALFDISHKNTKHKVGHLLLSSMDICLQSLTVQLLGNCVSQPVRCRFIVLTNLLSVDLVSCLR